VLHREHPEIGRSEQSRENGQRSELEQDFYVRPVRFERSRVERSASGDGSNLKERMHSELDTQESNELQESNGARVERSKGRTEFVRGGDAQAGCAAPRSVSARDLHRASCIVHPER